MNFETLIEALTCPLNNVEKSTETGSTKLFTNTKHFLDIPKYLPCCHRTACNKCIIKYLSARRISTANTDYIYNCPLCKITSRISLSGDECKLEDDELAKIELERNLNDINHYLVKKLETSMKNIEDRFESKENYLSKRKAYIEHEIHIQIETLKNHLDQLELEVKETLENSTKNMRINLEKFENMHRVELDEMKITIENLKSNSMNYINGDKDGNKLKINRSLSNALEHQSVNNCILHLNELNKIQHSFNDMVGELRFEPNVDLPEKSLVGNLKQINDLNLKEQFKTIKSQSYITKIRSLPSTNQQMPITPRYLCVGDPYNLFFTDSQTKQLIQLRLDTGDFVRSTNLNGKLRNPDGICVNPKAGHLFVGDSETKCIFKLDFEFNILKKFGLKDLKWPKGLFYDYESNSSNEAKNPNCLYACDYSGQRVAIYNEHEQLRDYLTISISDEPAIGIKASSAENQIEPKQVIYSDEEYKFCPLNVKVTKSLIYVTDDWTGGNCIRVFDKLTHQLIRNVGDLNAWNPLGMVIDDMGNLFTIARLYYETGQTSLFCFNKEGDLMYKTCLNLNSECISDIMVDKYTDRSNQRIVCSGDKKIHFIQF